MGTEWAGFVALMRGAVGVAGRGTARPVPARLHHRLPPPKFSQPALPRPLRPTLAARLWPPPCRLAASPQGLPPTLNVRAVSTDIKTFNRVSRAGGPAGMEVLPDGGGREKAQYGVKGPALPAEVGRAGGEGPGRHGWQV